MATVTLKEAKKFLRKGQHGMRDWNTWRQDTPGNEPDLRWSQLANADLSNANLVWANLSDSRLCGAELKNSNLSNANLEYADLSEADLSGADLRRASLAQANLSGANLRGAKLDQALLHGTNLRGVSLTDAILGAPILSATVIADVDLSTLGEQLIACTHRGPSTIGTDTLTQSRGRIPAEFLRASGFSEWEVVAAQLYDPNLSPEQITELQYRVFDQRIHGPIQASPIFISYSHKDADFVDAVCTLLNERSIRFWRDTKNAVPGRLDDVLSLGLRTHGTVLLVLSEASTGSSWVEFEVERALEHGSALCPVSLDDSWKTATFMSGALRTQINKYFVLDFSQWRNESVFDLQSSKLVRGLGIHYRQDPADANARG